MVVAVIADFKPGFCDKLRFFGIFVNPEPDKEERAVRVVLFQKVDNPAGFVRAPRRVESQRDHLFVGFHRVHRDKPFFGGKINGRNPADSRHRNEKYRNYRNDNRLKDVVLFHDNKHL